MDNKDTLLDTPLAMLGFSDAFRAFAAARDWHTLRSIVEIPLSRLLFIEGISDPFYTELTALLVKYQRLYLLKTTSRARRP